MSMMILGSLIILAIIYSTKFRNLSLPEILETIIVFVLVGYCGVFIFIISVYGIVNPTAIANFVNFPVGHRFQLFLTFSLLGMSVIALLSIWLRGSYLVAPVVCWSIFWLGATYVHLIDAYRNYGSISIKYVWIIFASHGLVSLILIAASVWRYRLKKL